MENILNLSTIELVDKFRKKETSPVDVAKATLEQAHELNPILNAFVLINDEDVLIKQAKESESRWQQNSPKGEIDGVPVTIKDWYHVNGWPTRYGSMISLKNPQTEDSASVARLRESGALFLGKTTLPEFGHKGVTDSPLCGITRNPWNTEKTSGGSSGGGGVAAATRMGFLHLGSDAGGSIRIPASFCGVFGYKPTPGLVPHWPPSLFSSLSSTGPMTRSVKDSALMLDIISKPDATDWNSVPYKKYNFLENCTKTPKNLRIAYIPTINDAPVDSEIANSVKNAVQKLSSIGKIEEISLNIPILVDTFLKHWKAAAALLLNQTPDEYKDKLDPYLVKWAKEGQQLTLDDYLEAELDRMHIGQQMKLLLEKYDILIMPSTTVTAFNATQNFPLHENGDAWEDWMPLTFPSNLAKLPAASLPCGITKDGMPIGLQVISGYLKDTMVFQVSHLLEQEINFQDWIKKGFSLRQDMAS